MSRKIIGVTVGTPISCSKIEKELGLAEYATKQWVKETIPAGVMVDASGEVITLSGSLDEKLKGLRVFGKTTQNGTPSPTAPVPLVSAGDGGSIGVNVAGKNLFNVNDIYRQQNCTISEDTITIDVDNTTGTATLWVNYYTNKSSALIPNTQYLAVLEVLEYSGNLGVIKPVASSVDTGTGQFESDFVIQNITKKNYTMVIQTRDSFDGCITMCRGYASVPAGETAKCKFRFSILADTSATGNDFVYEPYKGQALTVSTPNGLPGIHVSEGGNYTDENGWQWICDEVDFAKGVYVQRVYKKIFNGSESWADGGVSTGDAVRPYSSLPVNIIMPANASLKAPGMCDSYEQKTPDETWYKANGFAINTTNNRVLFLDSSITSIGEWKSRLSKRPVTCLFQLAEPIETLLSSEELAQYAALHTYTPNTTIYNDGGADMEVKYMGDTKSYIDKKFAELAAAIVNS